jgi:hypothetical protein
MCYDLYPETEQLESCPAFPACRTFCIGIAAGMTQADFEIFDGQTIG